MQEQLVEELEKEEVIELKVEAHFLGLVKVHPSMDLVKVH